MVIWNWWRSLSDAGVRDLNIYDPRRSASRSVNLICLYFGFINFIGGPVLSAFTRQPEYIIGGFIAAVLGIGIIWLNHLKRHEIANVCFYLLMNLATLYYGAVSGLTAAVPLMYFFLLALIFLIFEKNSTRFFCMGLLLIRVIGFEMSSGSLPSRPNAGVADGWVRWVPDIVILSFIMLIFFLFAEKHGLLASLYRHAEGIRKSLGKQLLLNKEKDHLFQEMSHEVRVAYFAVAGIAATLKSAVDNKEELSKKEALIHEMAGASKYYSYLLDNFLEYSKFQNAGTKHVRHEEIDLVSEIERIIELHQYIAVKKGINISLTLDEELPDIVICDRIMVNRIFLNLLSNAIKFTPEKMRVAVRVEKGNGCWRLAVTNEGDGITEEDLSSVFLPFVTKKGKRNEGGLGLGLPITKNLVELLGGSIQAFSRMDLDTSFIVSIPFR